MRLRISANCWTQWGELISYLATEYGFPASSRGEFTDFLRKYVGEGSTFQTKRGEWRFIIDITRDGINIDDIISIAIISIGSSVPRSDGAIITHACPVHPNSNSDGEQFVGGPELRWIMVTDGGKTYERCCNEKCHRSGQHVGRPELGWDITRLQIIRKAYEQKIAAINRKIPDLEEQLASEKKAKAKLQLTLDDTESQCRSLTTKLSISEIASKKLRLEIETLNQRQEGQDITVFKQPKTIAEFFNKQQQASNTPPLRLKMDKFKLERDSLRMCVASLKKENDVKTAIIQNLRTEQHLQATTLSPAKDVQRLKDKIARLERNQAGSAQITQEDEEEWMGKVRDQESRMTELSEEVKALQKLVETTRMKGIEEARRLEEENASLRNDIGTMKKQHTQDEETWRAEVHHLQDFNDQLRANGDAANNQKNNSDHEVAAMREQTKQLSSTISRLKNDVDLKISHGRAVEAALEELQRNSEQANREHASSISRLKEDIELKDNLIRQLQQSVILNPHDDLSRPSASRIKEQPVASVQEVEHHREIAARAQEQISDLESKLDTMKFGMQEKASEMASLEKYCAEKIQKAEVMERRCKDQEAYTVSLEKQLEELRGNMETMLGRVSVHQGRKRRRTEGPDFQL